MLAGLTTLDADTAQPLAAAGKWIGALPRVTALIAKEDVEIRAIETLEFIHEPDGSPTDDFVIPAWLDARQRLKRGEVGSSFADARPPVTIERPARAPGAGLGGATNRGLFTV